VFVIFLASAVCSGATSAAGDAAKEIGRVTWQGLRSRAAPVRTSAAPPDVKIEQAVVLCSDRATTYADISVRVTGPPPDNGDVVWIYVQTPDGRYYPSKEPLKTRDGYYADVYARIARAYTVLVVVAPAGKVQATQQYIDSRKRRGDWELGVDDLPSGSALAARSGEPVEYACPDGGQLRQPEPDGIRPVGGK
jgi:hypothetical protein